MHWVCELVLRFAGCDAWELLQPFVLVLPVQVCTSSASGSSSIKLPIASLKEIGVSYNSAVLDNQR